MEQTFNYFVSYMAKSDSDGIWEPYEREVKMKNEICDMGDVSELKSIIMSEERLYSFRIRILNFILLNKE